MKRWITLLGRGGTTLIAISLALLLVSIIPQPQMSRSEGYEALLPKRVQIAYHLQNLNPQQEVEVTVTVEGTLNVYLLEINVELQFINGTFESGFNLTDLQKILDEQPDLVIWEKKVENGEYKRSYAPTRVINATVVLHNPSSSEIAYPSYAVALKTSLAPGDKVRNIALWTTPIGIILAIPWLATLWKQKRQKLES